MEFEQIKPAHNELATATRPPLTMLSYGLILLRLQAGRWRQ